MVSLYSFWCSNWNESKQDQLPLPYSGSGKSNFYLPHRYYSLTSISLCLQSVLTESLSGKLRKIKLLNWYLWTFELILLTDGFMKCCYTVWPAMFVGNPSLLLLHRLVANSYTLLAAFTPIALFFMFVFRTSNNSHHRLYRILRCMNFIAELSESTDDQQTYMQLMNTDFSRNDTVGKSSDIESNCLGTGGNPIQLVVYQVSRETWV